MRDGCDAIGRWRRPSPTASGFCVDPDPTYLKTLRRINRLEDYHALKHHPVLIDLLERMLGGPILPHPRVLMRNIFPGARGIHHQGAPGFPQCAGHHRGLYRLDAADRLPDGGRTLADRGRFAHRRRLRLRHRRRRRRHRDHGSARRTLGLRRLRGRRRAAVPQHDGAQGRAEPQRQAAHVDGRALPTGQRAVQHRQRQSRRPAAVMGRGVRRTGGRTR